MRTADERIRWSKVATRADTEAFTDSYVGAVGHWRTMRLAGAVGFPLAGLFLWLVAAPLIGVILSFVLVPLLVFWRPIRRLECRLSARLMIPEKGVGCDYSVGDDGISCAMNYERGTKVRRSSWGSLRAWYEFDGALILMPRSTIYLWQLPLPAIETQHELRELVARKLPHSAENQRFADRLRQT